MLANANGTGNHREFRVLAKNTVTIEGQRAATGPRRTGSTPRHLSVNFAN